MTSGFQVTSEYDQVKEAPLFAFFYMYLPKRAKFSTVDRYCNVFFKKTKSKQLHFSFMVENLLPGNVVRLVSKSQQTYLDYSVYDMFRGHGLPKSAIIAIQRLASDYNIFFIGQLIQLDEQEVRALPFVTPKAFEALRTLMQSFRLDFNMSIPDWNKSLSKSLPVTLPVR